MVRVHSGSHSECRLSARWPPNLHPKQKACAVSPPVGGYHTRYHHQLLLLLSLIAGAHFTIPQRVERAEDLSRPRHCSTGV